jgi:S-adenosylmethionine decarboxylase
MNTSDGRGMHLIADLRDCRGSLGVKDVEDLLRKAAREGRAKVLSVHAHEFGGGGGIAAVAILAESHISVHTWPEYRYAAIDVFMCGPEAAPELALQAIVEGMGALEVSVQRIARQAMP